MSLHRRTHRRITLLTLYSLALSVAVVLWGAEYKMEQYPEQGLAFRVMPPAKLLTEKERPARKRSLRSVMAQVSQKRGSGESPVWAAPVLSCRVGSAFGEEQLAAVASIAFGTPEFTYYSSRPPPPRFLS